MVELFCWFYSAGTTFLEISEVDGTDAGVYYSFLSEYLDVLGELLLVAVLVDVEGRDEGYVEEELLVTPCTQLLEHYCGKLLKFWSK